MIACTANTHDCTSTLEIAHRRSQELSSRSYVPNAVAVVLWMQWCRGCARGGFRVGVAYFELFAKLSDLEVVLEDLGEVVLKLRATEVRQDFLPVWRILPQPTQQSILPPRLQKKKFRNTHKQVQTTSPRRLGR